MRQLLRFAAAALAAVGLCACANGALGRPLQVDDLLKMEGLGKTLISPDGRWLVIERRGPYASGARFDFDRYSDLFRTRLEVVDLRAPGLARPLLAHEPGVGYAAGPFSPDGARQAVFRLKDGCWELGLVTLGPGEVRWTGVTPDYPEYGRSVQWRSPTELVAITLPDGRLPFLLRYAAPTERLKPRWRDQARGGLAVTLLGSGRYADLRPRDPPRQLVVLDVASGAARTLAKGEFTDLELSTQGRWAAVLSAGPDIRMWPDQDFRTDTNIIRTRLRLTFIDLQNGRAIEPCPDCDVLSQLLSWSPVAEDLLVYARRDGERWEHGRLYRVSASAGKFRAVTGEGLRPVIFSRPETVAAGWLGGKPIVYGHRTDRPDRADWWSLGRERRALTGGLASFERRGAVATKDRLLLVSGGRAVALDASGEVRARALATVHPPPVPSTFPVPRMGVYLSVRNRLDGAGPSGQGALWTQFDARGTTRSVAIPSGAELLTAATDGSGVLLRVQRGGGEDQLVWTQPDGSTTPVLSVNAHLRDVDAPRVLPIRHRGPRNEPLTSWLVVPAQTADRPPPLIVFPYLGRTHETPPAYLSPRQSPGVDWPRVLVGHGYAVLLPSLPIPHDSASPADNVARNVLAIVDAAKTQSDTAGEFDLERLGVLGDSFGGYSTVAIVSQTDRFKAAVAWAAMPNLLAKWGDFGPPARISPERGVASPQWTEGFQADMRGPPWRTLERYIAGSPNLHLGEVRTPLLIGHGELDNFPVGEAEQTFSSYLRQNKDAVLATYWGEGHRLRSPANLRDFHIRALAWLDHHLGFTPPGQVGQIVTPVPASGAPNPRSSRLGRDESRHPSR